MIEERDAQEDAVFSSSKMIFDHSCSLGE